VSSAVSRTRTFRAAGNFGPKGVLVRSPGTGKTFVCSAVPPKAGGIHSPDGPDIMRKVLWRERGQLRAVFEERLARAGDFFHDEIDEVSLRSERKQYGRKWKKRVVAQLLA